MKSSVFKKAWDLAYIFFKRNRAPFFVDVDELYRDTLWWSVDKPWALEDGKFSALEHRYRFAIGYLRQKEQFEYQKTEYYKFITDAETKQFSGVYDGSRKYAMINPDGICLRYLALINSVVRNVDIYNALTKENFTTSLETLLDEIIAFERTHKKEVFYLKSRTCAQQRENRRYTLDNSVIKREFHKYLVGHYLPSAFRHHGRIIVKNGSHRLALFRALKEYGLFTNKFPVYLI